MTVRIEIGRRHYLAYLLLPHRVKMALMSGGSRQRLDTINQAFNERIYSSTGATEYDRAHRYAEAEAHDYPVRGLVDEHWVAGGYGRALELGAGSGYFTVMIARLHATSLLAMEPVPDMQAVLADRCRTAGIDNVRIVGYHRDWPHRPTSARPQSIPRSSCNPCITSTGGRLFSARPVASCGRGARLFDR